MPFQAMHNSEDANSIRKLFLKWLKLIKLIYSKNYKKIIYSINIFASVMLKPRANNNFRLEVNEH